MRRFDASTRPGGRRRIGHLLHHPVRRDSCAVSISDATVGRILAYLVATGRARPVLCFTAAARKRRRRQPRRVKRLRGALKANRPGDAVQIDTLSIWFPSNHTVKQFTAVNRCSRWGQGMAASRATAASAKRFLDRLIEQAPFEVRAIQVDGGSEFMADFEQTCKDRDSNSASCRRDRPSSTAESNASRPPTATSSTAPTPCRTGSNPSTAASTTSTTITTARDPTRPSEDSHRGSMSLPRFRGHFILVGGGTHDVEKEEPVPGRVPAADGGSGPVRA
ncbi:MAG: DDE-type integrase/transposase/recombinase [Holophagales bacterium]|nr:DDE-type integrase/transposase/recombinase [Holophagales bacterium]